MIDDHPDSAQSLAVLLQDMGHQTAFALNADSALDLVSRMKPHVVFVDLVLPDIDGHDLIRQLRSLPATRDARIYVVSAYGDEDNRRLSREAGADGHFTKPLDVYFLEKLLA